MELLEYVFIYLIGALGYGGVEMLWRGHTHWTMLLLGGICFVCIYVISVGTDLPPLVRWLLCAAAVTALELGCGVLVNLRLGWAVWDYSGEPGNILGQICPLFSLYWFLLSIPCSALARLLHQRVFEVL